jgi:hypothetical protein
MMVQEKFVCCKVVAVRVKTSPRTLAARRLVPRYATKKSLMGIRVVAKIRRIQGTCFYIFACTTLWTVALKRPIFKRKKGLKTLV